MTIDNLIEELYALVSDGYYSGAEVTYKGHAITGIQSIVHETPEEVELAWELTDEVDMYEEKPEMPKKPIDWEQRRFDLVKQMVANNWNAEQALDYADYTIEQYRKRNKKEDKQ